MKTNTTKKNNEITILLVGEDEVGKTSLSFYFTRGRPITQKELDDPKTLSVQSIYTTERNIENRDLTLHILDYIQTARIDGRTMGAFARVDGIIVVCDATRVDSIKAISSIWQQRVVENVENVERMPIYLIANKIDIVEDLETGRWIDEFEMVCGGGVFSNTSGFSKTSAETGEGVNEAFENLVKDILKKKTIVKEDDVPEEQEKSDCCVIL